MVGRKVLDGLRKGKKDIYALNVQYVKRYNACYITDCCHHDYHESLAKQTRTDSILPIVIS